MPDQSGYTVIVIDDEEHLYPAGDDAHDATRYCPCDPLRGEYARSRGPVWFHRTQAPPL